MVYYYAVRNNVLFEMGKNIDSPENFEERFGLVPGTAERMLSGAAFSPDEARKIQEKFPFSNLFFTDMDERIKVMPFLVISVSGRTCRLDDVDPWTIKTLDSTGIIKADCALIVNGMSAVEYDFNGRSTIVAVEQKACSPGDVLVHLPIGTFTLCSMTQEHAQKIVQGIPGISWYSQEERR